MIRQVELSLKFINKEKKIKLNNFLEKYKSAVLFFIDELWDSDEYKFVSYKVLKKCPIDITARAKQAAGKQALAIINGTLKKHKQRVYRRNILYQNGEDTSRLDDLIKQKPSKPTIDKVPAELDSRFIKFLDITNSFDLWIKVLNISLPLRKTKMFNKWSNIGQLKNSCRLTQNSIILYFDCEPHKNKSTSNIGIDIGINSVVTTSDGVQNKKCNHGHNLNSILKKISRKKKRSKAFKRATEHRKNFINWSINQLNLSNYKTIVIENIKRMRYGKNRGRFLSHFTYTTIFSKLERSCEEWNVSIVKINPAYTSQKCSYCGETETKNRDGEIFICIKCGYSQNADVNAAINILASV